MNNRQVGLWLYQNSGGNVIQSKLVNKLKERDIDTITGVDLGKAIVSNGNISCDTKGNCACNLNNQIDLLFSYNASESSPYQNYLYQALSKIMPLINNYESHILTEDKFQTSFLLKNSGIQTADYELCYKDDIKHIASTVQKWPQMVCKPTNGYGGAGLTKIDSKASLEMVNLVLNQINLKNIYMEKYIDYDNTDYRIDIVDGQFVACYGRRAKSGGWKTNIGSGGSVFLREPTDEIVNLALEATSATGLEIAGVDIIYDREKESYIVLEINGIPAFATPEQEKMGLNFNNKKIDLITDMIDRLTA
jgi:ribosomal protein S6--L-glutamate ligase